MVFSVFGNHTYAEAGTYGTTVTITNTGNGATAIASGQAVVADAALTPSATQPPVSQTEDRSSPARRLVHRRQPTLAPVTDYTYVTIDWGDGTPRPPARSPSREVSGTAFLVSGTHTYADAGVNGGIGHFHNHRQCPSTRTARPPRSPTPPTLPTCP